MPTTRTFFLLPAKRLASTDSCFHSGFSSGGTYTKLVHDTLVREQGLVTSLGNALVAIATGPDAANAKTLATQFTNAFNPAITKYSS